jgi:alkaline phosphatase D
LQTRPARAKAFERRTRDGRTACFSRGRIANYRAHQLFPWNVTWDDQEVDNNYASDKDQDGSRREDFLKRWASAYQAYYEHMPLRRTAVPKGSKLDLYRGLTSAISRISLCWTRAKRTHI